jgi:hypothetical protein
MATASVVREGRLKPMPSILPFSTVCRGRGKEDGRRERERGEGTERGTEDERERRSLARKKNLKREREREGGEGIEGWRSRPIDD